MPFGRKKRERAPDLEAQVQEYLARLRDVTQEPINPSFRLLMALTEEEKAEEQRLRKVRDLL
jgi:hypothetical protein